MTDRIRTVTVVLDRDYRDDNAEPILQALRMVRGVDSVAGIVSAPGEQMMREIAKSDLRRELLDAIHKILTPSY